MAERERKYIDDNLSVTATLFSEYVASLERVGLIHKDNQLLRSVEDHLISLDRGDSIWCQIDSDYMMREKTESYIGGNNDLLEKILPLIIEHVPEEVYNEISKMRLLDKDNGY